mgnify:CR=1 FL=1
MFKKEMKVTKDALNVVIGINVCLLSLIILVSNWISWLSFVSKGITYVIGFVGFWILIPYLFILGLYISFRKKLVKFRVGTSLIGVFFIIFAIGLLTSHFSTLNLYITKEIEEGTVIIKEKEMILTWERSISTFKAIFSKAFANKDSNLYRIEGSLIDGGVTCSSLGGGFFCYIFLGLFNSISSNKPTLMIVLSILLIVVGILLSGNKLISSLFAKLKRNKQVVPYEEPIGYSQVSESSNDDETNNQVIHEYDKYQIIDDVKPNDNNTKTDPDELLARSLESFNNQHTMQKALFSFDSDEQNVNSSVNNSIPTNDSTIGFNNNILQPNIETEPEVSLFSYDNVQKEESFEEAPLVQETSPNVSNSLFDNVYNEVDNNTNLVSEPAPVIEQTPVFEQPKVQTIEQPKPTTPLPTPAPEAPKKRVLHWDDDDDVVVDIPKAEPRMPYKFPPLTLLDPHEKPEDAMKNDQSCRDRIALLTAIFEELRIGASIVGYTIGPSVTQYDIKLNEGVSVKIFDKMLGDISIRLGGVPVLFNAFVLGKATSGLQVPNEVRTNVGLYESLLTYPNPNGECCDTTVPFGKDINGKIISLKVADFPHLLVAGTTGSGKSVFIHNLIVTLIMRNRPEDLKLVLIDPKGVEMSFYKKIPHLICPMIVDPSKANVALAKLVDEMEHRNKIFNSAGVRDIKEFNNIAPKMGYAKMPSIVIFVDEYADLSEQCKDIESKIQRIGQKARTAGIHLVIATQRPSVNIINGVIKANLPTRVALSVNSAQDSITIINEGGAENLLGYGDMLIDSQKLNRNQKVRVQSAYADTTEINKVCNFLRNNYQPMYWDEYHDLTEHNQDTSVPGSLATPLDKSATDSDQYFHIKEEVMEREYCSISYIQRTYAVGFPKAGKIFARLQEEGIVDKQIESASRGCRVLVRKPINEQQAGSYEQSETVLNFDPYAGN